MQENHDRLSQLVLRTMLLEGESCDLIIKATKKFLKEKQSAEAHAELLNTVKKEISNNAKHLMKDEIVDTFISELSSQVSIDE